MSAYNAPVQPQQAIPAKPTSGTNPLAQKFNAADDSEKLALVLAFFGTIASICILALGIHPRGSNVMGLASYYGIRKKRIGDLYYIAEGEDDIGRRAVDSLLRDTIFLDLDLNGGMNVNLDAGDQAAKLYGMTASMAAFAVLTLVGFIASFALLFAKIFDFSPINLGVVPAGAFGVTVLSCLLFIVLGAVFYTENHILYEFPSIVERAVFSFDFTELTKDAYKREYQALVANKDAYPYTTSGRLRQIFDKGSDGEGRPDYLKRYILDTEDSWDADRNQEIYGSLYVGPTYIYNRLGGAMVSSFAALILAVVGTGLSVAGAL